MRREVTFVGMVAASVVLGFASPALAHGLGGRSDLPVPLSFFIVGAGVVLVISFAALAALWPEPRLASGPVYRGAPRRVPAWLAVSLTASGLLVLAVVIVSGLIGDRAVRSHPGPPLVWVLFWLVLPFAAPLLGNVWAAINPWRTLGRWAGLPAGTHMPSWGVWPAAVAFLAFTWLELVYQRSFDPLALAVAALLYTAYMGVVMARFGTEQGPSSFGAFTVYHRLLSGIAPLGRDQAGALRRRGWLRALPVLPEWRGLTAFVVVMIGTVTYDGLSNAGWWEELWGDLVGNAQFGMPFGTLALLGVVGFVAAGYLAASAFAARLSGTMSTMEVAQSFAHTLVPIGLAYAFAHYFTAIVFEGQLLLLAASDPLGLGWDLFGTADWVINFRLISPTVVWWVQVAAIVTGHVAGVVLAHDRAIDRFPAETAVRTQYAMLLLMVLLTGLGLTILAG